MNTKTMIIKYLIIPLLSVTTIGITLLFLNDTISALSAFLAVFVVIFSLALHFKINKINTYLLGALKIMLFVSKMVFSKYSDLIAILAYKLNISVYGSIRIMTAIVMILLGSVSLLAQKFDLHYYWFIPFIALFFLHAWYGNKINWLDKSTIQKLTNTKPRSITKKISTELKDKLRKGGEDF